jgi:hypothetical protein
MAAATFAVLIVGLWRCSANASSFALQDGLLIAKERPVMKVVRILEDMQQQLQKDLDDDKAVHAKLACWCETNEREKSEAIAISRARITPLQTTMEEALASMSKLKKKRKSVMKELNANHAALSQASALRMRENKVFHGEEKDMLQAIRAIKEAVVALHKHNRPGLAQLRTMVNDLKSARVPELALAYHIAKGQMSVFNGFIQTDGAQSFLAIPGYQSYAPQSGEIFGVLTQMQEEFERSLSEAQKAELQAQTDYEVLKAAKQSEIAAAKKSKNQIDVDLADFSEQHALAAKELENVQAQLDLDEAFLADLTKKCSASAGEYDARLKSRLEELTAVEDTIKILNSDEAFAVFGKSASDPDSESFVANTALLQTSAHSVKANYRRARAVDALQRNELLTKAPELALIVSAVQLDAFSKVKEMITKLIEELGKQQEEEVHHRDSCIEELALNDRQTAEAEDKQTSLEAQMADLQKSIEMLTSDISTSAGEIAEIETQMKRASENREAESADYQATIADQRLTQTILHKAIERMMQVFAADELRIRRLTVSLLEGRHQEHEQEQQQPGAAHVMTSGTHTDAGNGPARFKEYQQNAGGKRIVALLETILADSKKTEDGAIASENDAQEAYESFMKDSNKSISSKSKAIADMTEARAKAKASFSLADTDLKETEHGLVGLTDTKGALHESCDFVLKNFDARQEARGEEIDALKDAAAILSGSK